VNLSPVVSDQFATGLPLRLTTLAQTRVQIGGLSHRRRNRLFYLCVAVAWAAASLAWVGAGLAIWDGNKTASAAVGSAVGTVMAATTFTQLSAGLRGSAETDGYWPGFRASLLDFGRGTQAMRNAAAGVGTNNNAKPTDTSRSTAASASHTNNPHSVAGRPSMFEAGDHDRPS
jgi:hypothetical protein